MTITYLKGDATSPRTLGPKIIPHIVNTVGRWGAGFVLAVSRRWTGPEAQYRSWSKRGPGFELGAIQLVRVETHTVVANMVAQEGIGESKGPPIRYEALEKCLKAVATEARVQRASIHMPRIGCSLGGGRWSKVEPILQQTLKDLDVYVYDFPGGHFNP